MAANDMPVTVAPTLAPAPDPARGNRVIMGFLLKAGGLYIAWHLFYQLILEREGGLIRDMAVHVAKMSAPLLQALGYPVTTGMYRGYERMLRHDGLDLVWIDSGCTGLTLMALFAGFIIAYPGPIRQKAWFIPAGLLLIHAVNLLRVVVLAINHIHSKQTFAFNHKYTYTLAVYAVIFGLWVWWANRYSGFALGNALITEPGAAEGGNTGQGAKDRA